MERTLTFTEPLRFLIFALENELLHYSLVIVVKWQTTAEERVEDNPQRPDIRLKSEVFATSEHLRAGVASSSAESLHPIVS